MHAVRISGAERGHPTTAEATAQTTTGSTAVWQQHCMTHRRYSNPFTFSIQ